VADTLYAPCGDLSLAYQVFGDGPVELVFVYGPISHVELCWVLPEFKVFLDRLSSFCRVLLFDKAGVGLSDPVPKVRTLDERAAEIEAVMDAAGFGQAVLFAAVEAGPAAIVFAATRPERTRALVLSGTFSATEFRWDDIDRDPDELRAVARAELGEDYMPSTEQITRLQEFARAVRSAWGTGAALSIAVRSPRASMRQLAMLERMCASPGMARASYEAMFRIDVRPILPTITVPTLVIHARKDPTPVQYGRYLADRIPGARYLEVDDVDPVPLFTTGS
jgi:pimeloyl-ACP methyl ester carboxylesterase